VAYPFVFESNFEQGTNGEWDTEVDTQTLVDFPSYKELARYGMEPYSGAYCMRLACSATVTADATVNEADINVGLAETHWFRFNIWFSPDFTATVNDTVHLLELKGAAAAVTMTFGFRVVAATDVINFGIGSAAAATVPDNWSAEPVERGVWHTVEIQALIAAAGGGTLAVYVTKEGGLQATAAEITVAATTNIAVTDGFLGLQERLITTTGTILIDNFLHDDGDDRPYRNTRYPQSRLMTKTGHVFVGPGKIDQLTLLAGGQGDSVVTIYDTDVASTADPVAVLSSAVSSETVQRDEPIYVSSGAYAVISGTASAVGPRALVKIAYAPYSAAGVRGAGSIGR
jgi:hypothetical protein